MTADAAAPVEAPAEGAAATAAAVAEPPAQEMAKPKAARAGRPKKARREEVFDFFGTPLPAEPEPAGAEGALSFGPAFEESAPPAGEAPGGAEAPSEDEAAAKPARAARGAPAVNPALLRKAINQIMPLFVGQDPGAKDCLKDHRATFRSAFTPEAYAEFEETVKTGDFAAASEHLKKAARRHGLAI